MLGCSTVAATCCAHAAAMPIASPGSDPTSPTIELIGGDHGRRK